jgi:CheY-like chemotaxis protein/two-component sensor histidine kinase
MTGGGNRPRREEELAAALHEVSNALTVILGTVETAASLAEDEGVRAPLKTALARARLANRIVREAIEAETVAEPPRRIRDVVLDAASGLAIEAARSRVEVAVYLEPALLEQATDAPSSLLQILTNLLMNAIAASPAAGRVSLDARCGPTIATIAVTDEGAGIPEERRLGLFVDGVSTRPGGAGIGLRHAAALSATLGGALTLASGATSGARFELAWPWVSDAAKRRESTLERSRILIVEDDAAVVELLQTALGLLGAELVVARRRTELTAALAAAPFDAVLVDLSPIEGDVHATLSALRGAAPRGALVVMSGDASAGNLLPEGLGVRLVRKPFSVGDLVRVIATNEGAPAPAHRTVASRRRAGFS